MNEGILLFGDVDVGDIIKVAVIFLLLAGPIVTKIVKSAQQAEARPKVPPKPPARAPRKAQEALHSEIDAFLRRAAQRRGAARAQNVEVLEPQRAESLVEAQVVPLQPVLGQGVATHVQEHIQARPFDQSIASLGKDVGQADEKLEGRLHEVFDHGLGRLAHATDEGHERQQVTEGTDSEVWQTAEAGRQQEKHDIEARGSKIAALLRDPSSLKDAVVMAEIFRRYDDRF
jgi:hypothetical protein